MERLTREALIEALDDYDVDDWNGYGGYDFESEVQAVLAVMMSDPEWAKVLCWGWDADTDGVLGGLVLGVWHPASDGQFIGRWLDWKALTDDREATGPDAAWAAYTALATVVEGLGV